MGQTLTNGLYLPAEGERNCYSGLESNWRALDAVIGGYNTHIANLNIHVTAADKQTWDTVTNKANDTDVLHKAGDETAAGIKTFSDATYVKSLNFTYNVPDPSSSSYSQFFITNTITYTSGDPSVTARVNFRVLANGTISIFPHENNLYSLGLQSRRFKDFYTHLVNNTNPGALSLPDLSAGVDISSYITNLNKSVNTFTPPANGWMFIRVRKSALDHVSIRMQQQNGLISSTETVDFSTWGCHLPVVASKAVEIYIYADSVASAYFYPCQGNI